MVEEQVAQQTITNPPFIKTLIAWVFHPFVIVHLGSIFITRILKHTFAQIIPLYLYNGTIKGINKVFKTNIKKVNRHSRLSRYILGALLAMQVTFLLSFFFWPDTLVINGYSTLQMHFINAVANPILYVFIKFFTEHSKIKWLQEFGKWLGSSEIEIDNLEKMDAGDFTKTIIFKSIGVENKKNQ